MEFFPVTSDKLSHDNQILTHSSKSFIQACLKVMKDQEHDLTSFEIRELSNFQIYMVNSPEENDYSDFEEDRMKRRLKQIEKRIKKTERARLKTYHTYLQPQILSNDYSVQASTFCLMKERVWILILFNETLFLKVYHKK